MKCALFTPFLRAERGNSITARRIINGLTESGFEIDASGFCETPLNHHITPVDIVHGFHAYYFGRDIIPYLPADMPTILSLTGTDYNVDLDDISRRSIILRALSRADKIVVFHQNAKDLILNQIPFYNSKVHIIPPGIEIVDEGYSAEIPGIESWEQVVLIVAGLRKVKNVSISIDAAAKVRQKGIPLKLVHVGPTIEEEVYQNIKARQHSNSWFISLGEVSHTLMARLYRRSAVVINTSLSEAIPNSILEAMYCQRPVIVSRIPGNLSVIQHNLNGLTYSSENELVEQLYMLLNNKEIAKKLGLAAEQYVKDNFNKKDEIAAYTRLYEEIILTSVRNKYDQV